METGCQNIQLASAILKVGFPPEVIGPLFMFPIVYILFQLIEAGVLILLSRCYQKYKTKHKGKRKHSHTHTHTHLKLPPLRRAVY